MVNHCVRTTYIPTQCLSLVVEYSRGFGETYFSPVCLSVCPCSQCSAIFQYHRKISGVRLSDNEFDSKGHGQRTNKNWVTSTFFRVQDKSGATSLVLWTRLQPYVMLTLNLMSESKSRSMVGISVSEWDQLNRDLFSVANNMLTCISTLEVKDICWY